MSRFYYDLHIHSCLSPCGDNESTPDSIAGMGELNGLNIMAITDHNSCKNAPSFFAAAERHNIVAVAGMELTTAEDIHMVCLFETLKDALKFDEMLETRKIFYKNKSEIFGNQFICDENDEVVSEEQNLLINATTVSFDEVPDLVKEYNGVCYPAHIDRESNGVIAILGAFPSYPEFKFAELHNGELLNHYSELTGIKKENFLVSSDAHYLWDIKERADYIELNLSQEASSDEVRKELFRFLRGAK